MKVTYGKGTTEYGPGVNVELDGDELASAVDLYLYAHGVLVNGARTITTRGELCGPCHVYVDPSGFVMYEGERYNGRGPDVPKAKASRRCPYCAVQLFPPGSCPRGCP